MAATTADVTWIDVLPSMKQFMPTLMREIGSSVPRAGQQAGQEFGASFGRGAVNQVEQASTKMHAALRKVEDAAGQVRVAEAKLQDLRDSGKAKTSQLVQAEENLAKSKRNLDTQNDQVTRSTRGLADAQERASKESRDLDKSLDGVSRRTSVFHGALGMMSGALAGLSFAAVGRGFYSIGETFDEVTDTIRAGTGKTGQALEGLVSSAKNVGKNVPAEFGAIGTTITEVNQRLGLTGPTLEKFTSQVLEAGRLAGEAIDVTALSGAFRQFNVTGADSSKVMDQLFRVSQATGVTINQLSAGLVKGGPVLQSFGFDVAESAVLLGTLDKAGLNSDATIGALRKALVQFAKDGRDPQEALRGTITEIQRFVAEGNTAAAIDLAAKLFGTKGASQFVAAVQSGAINVEALTAAAGQSGDTILGVANETKDFAERWMEFKNRVLVWLEPVAARVFGALGSAMVWVAKASEVFGEAWQRNDGVITRSGILGWLQGFASTAHQVFSGVQQALTAFGNAWRYNDGQITSSGIQGVFERLGFFARQTFDFLGNVVVPVLSTMAGFFVDNAWALGLLTAGFVAWRLAVAAGSAVLAVQAAGGLASWLMQTGIATKLTAAWTAVQWLLNASFMGFPVVWIAAALIAVGAGLYLLWTRSETFRDIVQGVWQAIQAAISWAWVSIIQPTFAALAAGWQATVAFMKWAWENVLQPAWNVIATVAGWLWNTILRPYFGLIWAYWQFMADIMVNIWNHILRPMWDLVAAVATGLYQVFLRPIFDLIGMAWTIMSNVMMAAWRMIILPMWTLLWGTAQFLWNTILSPIFSAIGWGFDVMSRGMRAVYDRVVHPMWGIMEGAIRGTQSVFETVVAGIMKAWNGLKYIIASPINFVIEVVFNRGLFTAWNWAVKNLGLPAAWRAPHWDQLPDGQRFAGGGQIPGYSPHKRADNIPIMATAREYMQPVDAVDHYGVAAMDAVRQRKASILFGKGGMIPGLASGGLVQFGRRLQGMGASVTEHPAFGGVAPVHGRNSKHYSGDAIDVNTRPGTSALEQRELEPMARLARSLGFRTIFMTAGHFNHLHVDTGPAGSSGGVGGGSFAIEKPWYDGVWSTITGAKDWLMGKVGAVGEMAGRFGDNTFVNVVKALPGKLAGGMWDKIAGPIADAMALFDESTGMMDPMTGAVPVGGAGVRAQVQQVANRFGWGSGAQWAALDRLITKESGWRLNAANPTSSARGLFQKMTSLNGPVEATAAGQAQWGLNYIRGRYGDPIRALAFHNRNNWYAGGGQVPAAPQVLDAGGLAAPGWWFNGTGSAERILTPDQNRGFERLVALAQDRGLGSDGGAAPVWHFYLGDREITDLIDARMEYQEETQGLDVRSARL